MEKTKYTAPETEIVEFETATNVVDGSPTGYEEGELPVMPTSGQRIGCSTARMSALTYHCLRW
ncbi:MAG: hypothetical protein J6M90_06495 [Oscillospiraceae bacterium]|nr:hypothetical protein [Oscillospiraceae bacterium]MBQ9209175.1 hypothetical protein [Oscillospiraceae bacterium]